MSSIRKFLDASTWVMFFAAVIFSFMTVVAQNALPGDSLYGFKLGYEKVMIASSRALNKQVDLQIDFVARRFDETTKVLASKHGGESLNRLNAEVESTAYTITMIEDPAEKKAAAKKYIAQLNVISSGLGQQKQNLAKSSPSYAAPAQPANTQTNANTNSGSTTYNPSVRQPTTPIANNNSGSISYPTATPTPAPTQGTGIIGAIDDTQQTIEETIEEMEQIAEQDTTPPPTPTNTPVPPTNTPIPPTPTTEPTVAPTEAPPSPTPTLTLEEKLRLFCQEHPQQCNNNNNSNNDNNNGIGNDD